MTHSRTGFGSRLVGLLSTVVFTVLWPVAAIAQVMPKADFDIPPQRLEAALQQVAQVQRVQILFSENDVRGLKTPGVKGKLSTYEAVQRLIEGTGLSAVANQNNAIAIRPKSASEKGGQAANPTLLAQAQSAERQAGAAQDQRASSDQQAVRGEAIVVTAQKRSELLIDVPQSVTVLTADDLAKLGAVQFRDFANTIPGLAFATQGAGFSQITLRGVTTGIDIGPTVGVYVDEVPYGSSSSLSFSGRLPLDVGLFDLDRIEVLRGPQGTLYGASSMGGLIKYVTRRPDASRFGGEGQTSISSTRSGGLSHNASATVNVPIVTDRVALRASGFFSRDGGYVDNLSLNQKDVDQSDVKGGRLDVMFTPNDALRIRITGFLQDISRDGKTIADYFTRGGAVDSPLDQRRLVAEPFDQTFRLVSASVVYDLGPASLTSISAHQSGRTDFVSDSSATFLPTALGAPYSSRGTLSHQTTERFTQEVRLHGARSRSFEWLVGGFYSDEETDVHQEYILRDRAGQPAPNNLFNLTSPIGVKEYAAFGDLTWYLTDKLDVTGGIRRSRNRGTFETIGSGLQLVPRPLTRSSEDVSTYLANARYHFGSTATGYLRYATGYRPGGPNFVIRNPTTGLPVGPDTFEADKLSSYEAGFKAETANRRFSIDFSGYYIKWTNMQVLTFLGGGVFRTNSPGGATVRGGELSLIARPTRNLTLQGAFAYTNAQLSEANASLGAADGERLPNVPRATAFLNADYELFGGAWRPTAGVTLRYVSDRTATFGSTAYRLPEYTSVDLRAGFMLGAFSVQLYVHNVSDKRGQTSFTLSPAGIQGVTSVSILQPRTIGISARTTF